jgi:deazaflavin-dependent oxidoreductase (nitroreductase family)
MATWRDVFVRFMTSMHEGSYRATHGAIQQSVLGMPVVRMTVTGRRSGLPRVVMLSAPIQEPGLLVVVASNFGADDDPEWYRNVLVNPDVLVDIEGVPHPMRARPASPAEHAALWPRVVEAFAGYRRYQERTGRTIPLVFLDPR